MKTQKAAGINLPQFRAPSVCEACGAAFICGANDFSCWCQEIKLSEETLMNLRARYRGCLCRACLENYAKGEKKDGEKEEQVPTGQAH